jgi:hypothetical protein
VTEQQPHLRIVRGNPDAVEIAAVVAALTALRAPSGAPAPQRSLWSSRARNTRPAMRPSPGAWRASMMPR